MSKVVALDIGHGSNTFPPSKGVYKGGKGYAENDFNAKLVLEIDKLLKSNGVKTIIYQKPYENDINLTTRTNYYNNKKVDLVYSIHANYSSDSNANGRCVFYWHNSKQSKKVADIVVDEIKKSGYSTHGSGYHASKRGSWTNLAICRQTNMPAVLVENGFMSGSEDFHLVFGSKQNEYIKDMAKVHAKAICRYFGIGFNGKINTPKPSKKPSSKPNHKGKANYKTNSLVDFLSSINEPFSFNDRKKLAKKYGVGRGNYSGKANQNAELLSRIRKDYKKNGKLTGNSTSNTKRKANLPNGVLKVGNRGAKVKQLQRALNKANYKVGKVDGIYGAKTKDAVRRVQLMYETNKNYIDGIYGKRTKGYINKLI